MKIDELRDELHAAAERAGASVHLDVAAVRARGLRKSGAALGRLRAWLVVELAIDGFAVAWLGAFLAGHLGQPALLVCASLLDVMAVVQLVAAVRKLVGLRRVDLDDALVPCQRKLAKLRVERIRLTAATLLVAPLLWIPVLAVLVAGIFDVDLFCRVSTAWWVTNVLVGAAFVPLMLLLARRHAHRFAGSPFVQRLLRDLSGYNLSLAEAFLAEIAELDRTTA